MSTTTLVPRDNKIHLQKESGPKVLSFSLNLALRGIHTMNDTHYEIIAVDIRTFPSKKVDIHYTVILITLKMKRPNP